MLCQRLKDEISQGAEILRNGGLVAFPTETVYGLGADALNPEAVARVYKVKGRPSDNPLIWHIGGLDNLPDAKLNPLANKLAKTFWPGPLTMVLSQGAGTIAVRVPAHPVAQALIAESGLIIAAPSANISGRPSPTKAQHVIDDFKDSIDLIIDGGSCENGLESTVIDLHTGSARLLRPGSVTLEMLQAVIGKVETPNPEDLKGSPLSPGMKYRHYAPAAPLILLIGSEQSVTGYIKSKEGQNIGILRSSGSDPTVIAQTLFDRLRQFDQMGVSLIIAEGIKEEGIGLAVMNRLKKAAAEVVFL